MSLQPTYTLAHIASILGGDFHGIPSEIPIRYLLTDSRKVLFPGTSVFFAIPGAHHNGHDYITQAYEAGVKHFIISDPLAIRNDHSDISYLVVNDVLKALQNLTAHHRSLFSIPVIGITGSNGKTIVKDWLYQVLSSKYNVCRNPKSYNSQVGVPLSVWNLREEDEIGIFEAGISDPGEMKNLEKILQPSTGIFTNIGSAHDENFSGIREKIAEKILLFKNAERIIFSADHAEAAEMIRQQYPEKQMISWGKNENALYRYSVKPKEAGVEVFVTDGNINDAYLLPFTDKASIENSLHVFITCISIGMDRAWVSGQMATLPGVNMRLSFKTGKDHCFIIDDTYSNDLDSLKIALDSLAQLSQYDQKAVILSDIVQSRIPARELYAEVALVLKSRGIKKLVGIGEELSSCKDLFEGETWFYPDVASYLKEMEKISFHNEAILVKGARIFEMEKIVYRLEDKYHDTVLEVNLNAMVRNLNYYRRRLPAGTKVMAMVKASGYGTGTHEIAHILRFHHVDYLAVAYADEGMELRQQGIRLPLMIMNAEEASLSLLAEHQLEPAIYSFESLQALVEHHIKGLPVPPVHLEIDSGMHRLGFLPSDISRLVEILKKYPGIKVKSIFSHLAAADEPSMDAFTLQQVEVFKNAANDLERSLQISCMKHIANSAGASRFPSAAFDMVRLGIGLYGIGTNPEEQVRLEPVIRLSSVVAQVKHIPAGDSIGYGRSYMAAKDMTIAIVPIGYADGYRRSLANGTGKMYIDGKPAPVVGRVCMDMTMIDITGMKVVTGDKVEIIGENHPIEVFAQALQTIPYEVLTSVSSRVKRIYIQE